MRKKIIVAFSFCILLFAILTFSFLIYRAKNPKLPGQQFPDGQIYEIVLTDKGFSSSEITIKPGDSIKFSTILEEPFWPASDLHPTHGIYPEFDPQEPVDPNKNWTFQFSKTGLWKYHDHLNPSFRGTIIVK